MLCTFVGYPKDHASDTYRMLNLKTNKTIITRDIFWLDKLYGDHFNLKRKNVLDHLDREVELEEEEEENMNESINQTNESGNDEIETADDTKETRQSERIQDQKQMSKTMERIERELKTSYNPNPLQRLLPC